MTAPAPDRFRVTCVEARTAREARRILESQHPGFRLVGLRRTNPGTREGGFVAEAVAKTREELGLGPTPEQEERDARLQERVLERARRAAARRREADYVRRLREAVADTRATYPRCRCALGGARRPADLRALGGGCTMPLFACPRLAAVRRRMGA